jgi:hypothetical protein
MNRLSCGAVHAALGGPTPFDNAFTVGPWPVEGWTCAGTAGAGSEPMGVERPGSMEASAVDADPGAIGSD